jgi:hypothetical protein|tara:strand:- start:637 stop:1335 length:699 start_codon:yes stop_codon:yes gene_type:complete
MIEKTSFETFIYISKNKYQIFVYDKNKYINLYDNELLINDEIALSNLDQLSNFLDENIYKIEKKVNNFIKSVIVIIEDDNILNTSISLKKNNYDKQINQKYLKSNLIEIKDLFKENYQDQIIMHMILVNKDEKEYLSKNIDINQDHLFLEVSFISLSNNITIFFDKLFEKHQIKISKYMSAKYIKSFINKETSELSMMANKLKNGHNQNEVIIVSKNIENKGLFEKFFQLFS